MNPITMTFLFVASIIAFYFILLLGAYFSNEMFSKNYRRFDCGGQKELKFKHKALGWKKATDFLNEISYHYLRAVIFAIVFALIKILMENLFGW